jgi:hypothetical protein
MAKGKGIFRIQIFMTADFRCLVDTVTHHKYERRIVIHVDIDKAMSSGVIDTVMSWQSLESHHIDIVKHMEHVATRIIGIHMAVNS